jgi:DNA primase
MVLDSAIESIRQRIVLSSLVGRYVRLVRKGRYFVGLCPFHAEKTPSFTVNDDKGIYHCFGCGARGDLIDFTRHQKSISFSEAIKELAQQAGIEIERESKPQGSNEHTFFDRFRHRLMFPITNAKGSVIGFGGRSLGDEQPKYLNSPETSLFIKGHNLYRSLHRVHSRKVLFVEGYLDVIASSRSYTAFAPLGTAVSPEQLKLLWGHSPEPVICLDSDEAGRRASDKIALMALPLLKPGYSLFFATLPSGHDPHSLIQTGQEKALKRAVDQALPLSEYLWKKAFRDKSLTPERKAQATAQWKEWVQSIGDTEVRHFYRQFFYNMHNKKEVSRVPSVSSVEIHQKILLGMLVLYPDMIEKVREQLSHMRFEEFSPWLQVRDYLLLWNKGDSFSKLSTYLGEQWEVHLQCVTRHIPSHLPCLETYWLDMFNAYQTHLYQKEELSSLQKEIMVVPGAWERLKTLIEI